MKRVRTNACWGFFSTLSNPTRVAILVLLEEKPRNVGELARELKQEQSMVSHNLSPLVRCRFVFVKKHGKERIYSLNKKTMAPLFKIIYKHMGSNCPGRSVCTCPLQ
ncbi:MAG: metalloregulator ArsR/SmtB family transcription factor [Candidatus Micrarchaeota archaeon]